MHLKGSDPLVVPTGDLRLVLRAFIAEIDAEARPTWGISAGGWYQTDHPTRPARPMPPKLGGVSLLERDSGIDQARIYKILSEKNPQPYVGLRVADQLLAAAGRPDAVHCGDVRVVRNPRLSESNFRRRMREAGLSEAEVVQLLRATGEQRQETT